MRGLKGLLALAALLSFVVVAQAQETVSYYGFDFPLRIGALTRGDVTNFEKSNPGLGYGIRYSGTGARVDIFVYDLGKRSIDRNILSADQRQEFDNTVRDVHRGKDRGFYRSVTDGVEFEIPAGKNPFFRCKTFLIDRGEGRVEDSALCLGARNDKFFKIRIGLMPPAPDVPGRMGKLVRQIAHAVKF